MIKNPSPPIWRQSDKSEILCGLWLIILGISINLKISVGYVLVCTGIFIYHCSRAFYLSWQESKKEVSAKAANLVQIGDVRVCTTDEAQPEILPYTLIIQCSSAEQCRQAMNEGHIDFTCFEYSTEMEDES